MVQPGFPAKQLIIPTASGGVVQRAGLSLWTWAGVYLLLAVAQVLIGGYQFGVGNQGIQVPLLERAIDPHLFAHDAMVTGTGADYPTYFFRLLAIPAKWAGVGRLYLILHVLTAWAAIATIVALGRAMVRSRAAGLIAAMVLLAGHLQALGGDGLYSTGFTHTFAVWPLAIGCLALAYHRRYGWAVLVAGLTFNLHALTAAYVAVFIAAMWIGEVWVGRTFLSATERGTPRSVRADEYIVPWRTGMSAPPMRYLWQPPLLVAIFALAAWPTLQEMAVHRQVFDAQWVGLTHVRSADHSFPSVWWQSGSSDVPRFALLAGLFALSLGFRSPARQRRQTLAIMAAAAVLFAIGYLLADVWPVPTVIRAQLYRCSRLVMVVMLVQIAFGIVRAIRLRRWLELAAVAFAVVTLAVPGLLPLLPVAFVAWVVVALIHSRLSLPIAVATGLVMFISVAAHRDLGFALLAKPQAAQPSFGLVAIATAALLALVARFASRREQVFALTIAAALAIALLVIGQHDTTDAWSDVQAWARDNTPADAVFLTPIQPGGFRLESQRAVVGEWRDGTQLYFSAGFAPQWWGRMLDLQPGLLTDASGRNILSTGRPLSSLDDEAVVALATKYGASHVVMRKQPGRELPVAYSNGEYAVYLPQLPSPVAPAEATDKDRWLFDEKFMRETVLPNIDRYRKGDAKLQLFDSDGRPLAGATVEVRQVSSAFNFSASLPFFLKPAGSPSNGDYVPPPVDPRELDRFREIFNASMIPFSGKWMYVEPREGELHFEDLDRYVDWCTQNHIRLEYHFLSGYFAPWVKQKNPQQQGEAFLRHAKQIAERYGDRIPYWQVVNETILIQQSPPVFKMLRQMMPNAKLGISDCAKFAPETKSKRRNDVRSDMIRGLAEVKWLKSQGVQPDFFGFHGHRPFGIWPEASQMYASLDEFAHEGVKVHITEFTVPENTPVISPIRGGNFTPDVQAQFYERFFTICFSHPAVELINIWGIGPNTWQQGSGLLDANYDPKATFFTLKKLITETWRTNATLKTDIEGLASFRGFHGDYVATVKTAEGRSHELKFTIKPGDELTHVQDTLPR